MSSYKIVFIGYRSRCQFAGHAFELRAAKPARENTRQCAAAIPNQSGRRQHYCLRPGKLFSRFGSDDFQFCLQPTDLRIEFAKTHTWRSDQPFTLKRTIFLVIGRFHTHVSHLSFGFLFIVEKNKIEIRSFHSADYRARKLFRQLWISCQAVDFNIRKVRQ
jgi:hypothetical protein